jgi:hypothetical protein
MSSLMTGVDGEVRMSFSQKLFTEHTLTPAYVKHPLDPDPIDMDELIKLLPT